MDEVLFTDTDANISTFYCSKLGENYIQLSNINDQFSHFNNRCTFAIVPIMTRSEAAA